MATDLYKLCPRCGGTNAIPKGGGIMCTGCVAKGVVPTGLALEDVDHATGRLEEAGERLARGHTKMLALLASSDRLKELLREAADLNKDYAVRIEAVGRVLMHLAGRLDVHPDRIVEMIEAEISAVRAEYSEMN